ncbi:hypothetical protein [Proteus mirabilis]|uniref:hypothetical protein n=1 Tax=Proteus mirabilis TaxID=584 RepID=UPI0034D793BB
MSTISYGNTAHRSRGQRFQSAALGNFGDLFKSYGGDNINLLSEDVTTLVQDAAAFNEYTDQLMNGIEDQGLREDFMILAENTRKSMLQESMINGINPIASLSMPMLRIGFPKMAIREGMPTEPVEQPKFKVTTKKPYIIDSKTGEKLWLPAALTQHQDKFRLPQLSTDPINATAGVITDHDLLTGIGKSAALGDEIDPVFSITEVVIDSETFNVGFELDTNINVVKGEVTLANGTQVCVMATLNREKGKISVAAIGGVLKSIRVRGYVSSEMNNAATQVGFDIDGVDITIGTGHPIESPINIQQMTDAMAMYEVDSTLSHMETMSTVLAQRTDLDGIAHLENEFEKSVAKIQTSFDVKPPSNYNMGDQAWREQIKIHFDRLVTRLQMQYNIYQGKAVVFCNNLDAQVVSNIKWVYNGDAQPNGVAVDYKVGSFTSSVTSYLLLQSPNIPQGRYIILYVPTEPDFKTSVYYPYSFNVIRGSVSPNTSNLAAIQMIKRYIFRTFTPMIAMLNIKNNSATDQ